MAGEIHGIISREDAWRTWAPYGERVVGRLDNSVAIDTASVYDITQVALGSEASMVDAMRAELNIGNDVDHWEKPIIRAVRAGNRPVSELLVKSNQEQGKLADHERQRSLERTPAYLRLIKRAVANLTKDNLWSPAQEATIISRFLAPDGTPFVQDTPMTLLEAARLYKHDYGSRPKDYAGDGTWLADGIICAPLFHCIDGYQTQERANKVHEHVHGYIEGIEMYDVRRDDGRRLAMQTVIGISSYEPYTDMRPGDDYSFVRDLEVSEGWTEYVAQQVMVSQPKLGTPIIGLPGYGEWAMTLAALQDDAPELFRHITIAALTEATPEQPTVKRDALAEMHDYADHALGTPNSLQKHFQAAGGDFETAHETGMER